ncbi:MULTISPECIES: DUF805 domain-containing protein [unclassified Variovorax]|uniref:DUF805 domain-containing protein n=1 Tax=unclassified Variovorax TaxID=663243 RepID=UPI001BD60055|nr:MULTISPECIES: DUF805 domain-containing protein [unclassified Variovorax]
MAQAVNPYAAPTAIVADRYAADDTVQPVRLFSARGRIGRLRYLANAVGAYLVMIAAVLAVSVVVGAIAGGTGHGGLASALGGGIGVLLSIPYLVFLVLKLIQRSHDMDWNGWMTLLAFIPLVGLIWVFKPGTDGPNRYGAPPPANTTLVKIGGLIVPVIAAIGILAAVALPAYQQYVQRAKAAQVVKP